MDAWYRAAKPRLRPRHPLSVQPEWTAGYAAGAQAIIRHLAADFRPRRKAGLLEAHVRSDALDVELLSGPDMSFDAHPALAERARQLLARGPELLQNYPNVTGAALSFRYTSGEIRTEEPCITFFVTRKDARTRLSEHEAIPALIEGIPTDVVEAGDPELLQVPSHVRGQLNRPAEPGDSVSHGSSVTSGTLGCLVEDARGVRYILSCAHVLAGASASPGDPIYQPGTAFQAANAANIVATLTSSVPLAAGVCVADAAIAELEPAASVSSALKHIGTTPAGTRVLNEVGVVVQKSGDATGLTRGLVIGLNGTVGPHRTGAFSDVFFTDAILTSGMSRPGDSGSLLVDAQNRAIGLLFGGLMQTDPQGNVSYVVSWYNPIEAVLKHFGITLVS